MQVQMSALQTQLAEAQKVAAEAEVLRAKLALAALPSQLPNVREVSPLLKGLEAGADITVVNTHSFYL